MIRPRITRHYVLYQQIRSAGLIELVLAIPVVCQRLGSACAGLKFQCAAHQNRLILQLPGKLGYHADVEFGFPASHEAGFIPHLDLVQPTVVLLHDADFKHRAVGSLNRAASVVPLVSQRACASGFNGEPRDGAFTHRQVIRLLCNLHRQHDHQRCGGALHRTSTVGDQHGIVTLIRNRYALQLQFRLQRALQRHPVLEPLVRQGLAAARDQAEQHRLALHHALAGRCPNDLRQRHNIQARLAAP